MQLHQDDALLAHPNHSNISDTDSEATIPENTVFPMSAQGLEPTRWPSPTSPTESGAARRKKLKTRPRSRRGLIPTSSGDRLLHLRVDAIRLDECASSSLNAAPLERLKDPPSLQVHPLAPPISPSRCNSPPTQSWDTHTHSIIRPSSSPRYSACRPYASPNTQSQSQSQSSSSARQYQHPAPFLSVSGRYDMMPRAPSSSSPPPNYTAVEHHQSLPSRPESGQHAELMRSI